MVSRRLTNQGTTPVSEPTVAQATESIYTSLRADNADIDAHIATLKAALTREGVKQAVFDPTRLAHCDSWICQSMRKSVPEIVMYIVISDLINALAEFMSYYVRGATNGRQGSLRF